jgi:hypothetical protein
MQGGGYIDVNSFLQLRRKFLTIVALPAAIFSLRGVGRA